MKHEQLPKVRLDVDFNAPIVMVPRNSASKQALLLSAHSQTRSPAAPFASRLAGGVEARTGGRSIVVTLTNRTATAGTSLLLLEPQSLDG